MGTITRKQTDAEMHAAFWRDGHILVPKLAARNEVENYREAISTAVEKFSTETRSLEERDTYGKAFVQVMNLWRHCDDVKHFVFERRFAAVAASLLGVEKVRLYHDQALFKEPRGGYTPWHQDQFYWPLDTDKTVTMWMPLVDIDDEMGMLTFASGSHKNRAAGNVEISDESDAMFSRFIVENALPVVKTSQMRAGDATFHLGWTVHSAGENRSAFKAREVMTVIYFADGARISTPQNEFQKADLAAWLGGKKPGELADSELNPVLN